MESYETKVMDFRKRERLFAENLALKTKAPERWYGRAQIPVAKPTEADTPVADDAVEVGATARKKAWARLLAKV